MLIRSCRSVLLDVVHVEVQLRAVVGLEDDDRRLGRLGQDAVDRLLDPTGDEGRLVAVSPTEMSRVLGNGLDPFALEEM